MRATGSPEERSPWAVAVVPVRSGILPVGAAEAVAEAGGRCWLVGSGCAEARLALETPVEAVAIAETSGRLPSGRLATALAAALVGELGPGTTVILPSSPDGRDLAPLLAVALDRPLVAGATAVGADGAVVARRGGRTMETVAVRRPVVATLQPGARGVPPPDDRRDEIAEATTIELDEIVSTADAEGGLVELLAELPADPATMDLADAPRIVAGGAGLGSADQFAGLHAVADALGASVGATRVVTDQGWITTDRQIGTTGVTVDPELYLAVGISGAVQHTAGLGTPDHIVAVNIDPFCPMMELADLAIVSDGPGFVAALAEALALVNRRPASRAARPEPVPEA